MFSNLAFTVFFFKSLWKFKCVIFFKVTKIAIITKTILRGHGDIALAPEPGAPKAERRPGASWNITDFRLCKLQFSPNYDVVSKKKVFTEILTVFSVKIRWSAKKRSSPKFRWASFELMGPGVIVPPCPPFGGPAQNSVFCQCEKLLSLQIYYLRDLNSF